MTTDKDAHVRLDFNISRDIRGRHCIAYCRMTTRDIVEATEFYWACTANGYDPERIAALRDLTDGYEQAAFALETPTPDQAEATVDAATRVLEPAAAE